jgi:hypothetical protein
MFIMAHPCRAGHMPLFGSDLRMLRVKRLAAPVERSPDLPDRLLCRWCVQPLCKKYFRSRATQITFTSSPSRPTEGRFAVVTDAGRDAVDAGGAADESAGLRTAKSCGPDASTLAFKSAQETAPVMVTKKPDHRGEREGNR